MQSQMLTHRVRAWLRSIPTPRLRRIILGLYLAVAAVDAAGKVLTRKGPPAKTCSHVL